jgi:hypothetical protein
MSDKDQQKDQQSTKSDVAEVVQVEVVAEHVVAEDANAQLEVDPDLIYEVCSYETVRFKVHK